MAVQIRLSEIYNSFDSSLRALYKLHTAIQDSFAAEEWKALEEEYQDILSLLDDYDPLEVQTILERLIQIDVEDETINYRKILEAINTDSDDILRFENDREVFIREIQDGLNEFARLYPEKANKFFRAYLKTQREEPFKSELSRHGLLLSAVSQFEFLFLHLLRAYFVYHEHDTALCEVCTIEELDEQISQRIGKRLKYFSTFEKLDFIIGKFPLDEHFSRDRLKEIFERRNVFAHRSGRADETYIQYNSRVQVGDKLRISQTYIKNAIEYLHLWGLVLCAKVWEKLDVPEEKNAGKAISDTALRLIRDGRYDFCASVCKQVHSDIQLKSRNSREILMINYAICMDKLGREKEKLRILSGIRQTPREELTVMKEKPVQEHFMYTIPMAVSALQGQKQRALDLLERAADANQVTFLDLDYWIIFDYLADEPRFQQIKQELELKASIA